MSTPSLLADNTWPFFREICPTLAHPDLGDLMGRRFAQVDALCPSLSPSSLATVLRHLGMPCPYGSWAAKAVNLAKARFTPGIFVEGMLPPEIRHRFNESLVNYAFVVKAIIKILKKCSFSLSVMDNYLYFKLYFDEPIPIKFAVERMPAIISKNLAQVNFTTEWYLSLPTQIKDCILDAFSSDFLHGTIWATAAMLLHAGKPSVPLFPLAQLRLLQDRDWHPPSEAFPPFAAASLDGLRLLLHEEYAAAAVKLEQIEKAWRQKIRRRSAPLGAEHGLFLNVARLGSRTNLKGMAAECERLARMRFCDDGTTCGYAALLRFCQGHMAPGAGNAGQAPLAPPHGGEHLFALLLHYHACALEGKGGWLRQCAALRDALRGLAPVAAAILDDAVAKGGGTPRPMTAPHPDWRLLSDAGAPWKARLAALEAVCAEAPGQCLARPRRLVWVLDTEFGDAYPKVQVRQGNGSWSTGQKFAARRLAEDADALGWLTPQDRAMVAAYGDAGWNHWKFVPERGLPLLAGHPLIFDAADGRQITLEKRPADLVVTEDAAGFHAALSVKPGIRGTVALWKIGRQAWAVCVFTPLQRALFDVLGAGGLSLPREAMPRLMALSRTSPVPVRMAIDADEQPARSEPVVQLRQQGASFAAAIRVRPGADGDALVPGKGPDCVLADSGGRPMRFRRDFQEETRQALALVQACPTFARGRDGWEWTSGEPDDILDLLGELRDAGCRVEWPEGARIRLAGDVRRADVTIRTEGTGEDWFALSGDVRLSSGRVLALKDVLERLEAGGGRYVELSPGEFLALSKQAANALRRLKMLAGGRKEGALSLHPLATAFAEDIFAGMRRESNGAWAEAVRKMRAAMADTPAVPPDLRAELRPYQREGFLWMCRLAAWGAGACLADDMGLGKTVQAIAVLLREARRGPLLVVAPTSVCPNWESEIRRFAPSLRVRRLREAEDRTAAVQGMGAGMVLIVGYGLLRVELEKLASQRWRMVVFDEAQALKNGASLRSRAAVAIPAEFRLALTGTPIENHLDDLWSLFNVLNPGLLGTRRLFHRRFGGAAAGGEAAAALKRLIRPFILRRMKGQVLDDLPPRTEQTILVEPTDRERHFYEALRQSCLEKLASVDAGAQRRICILSELTRLRRACCHAGLAVPGAGREVESVSSKMACFKELLDEARAGGHRMLVFSQFVGFLSLVRAQLEHLGVACQYLDGSTPEDARQRRVAAFQKGEGDVFLISLRAGGQGLNLTAADYVVHLDPWWNPAVEDQATDRACRIGQQRPVTVYRLAVAHSVEEKILALHERKRELAANFLAGTEDAADISRLSEEELLALFS